jgi:hypothetical protein
MIRDSYRDILKEKSGTAEDVRVKDEAQSSLGRCVHVGMYVICARLSTQFGNPPCLLSEQHDARPPHCGGQLCTQGMGGGGATWGQGEVGARCWWP